MKGYHLVNAEELANKHPNTFAIPSKQIRYHLHTPDLVKLMFEPIDGGLVERIWVRITGPSATQNHFIGTINNIPLNDNLPKLGMAIEFGPEHIIDWQEVVKVNGPLELHNLPVIGK